MKYLQKPLLLFLALTSALAAPILPPDALRPRQESRILPRQRNITQPVSFQTVETTQTQVGTVTQTCKVTLTPITGSGGAQSVREDKDCTYAVLPPGQSPPPPPANSGSAPPPNQADTPAPTNGPQTAPTSAGAGVTTSSSSSSASVSTSVSTDPTSTSSSSAVPTNTNPVAADTTSSSSAPPTDTTTSTSPAATTPVPAPTSSDSPATTASPTTPTTITSTLVDGSVTTLTSTPSAAQAQASSGQEEVPGRKLEVLPIGLGVFAGISVIALIVVGLVTYERTKYRRAFRQRKLAEAGANMGYGGMAERT